MNHRSRWMGPVLWAAAIYNIVWGSFVVFWPLAPFRWAEMPPPSYPQLWQCIGMMVAVFGVGYAIAAIDPMRHWPIVLVGLLGKVFGPIGFFLSALAGELPWVAGWTILTNDLVWWVPFTLILREKYRRFLDETDAARPTLAEALAGAVDQHGTRLDELSHRAPVLLVFLRHLG